MKTIVLTLLVPLLYTNLFSQSLNIHKNDGSRQNFILSEIDSITFSGLPCPGIPTITYEGKIYNTVLIGEQCWLKENLDVGIMITGGVPQTQNTTIEKYCYNNETDSCDIYGGLYQWDEAVQYADPPAGAQGICPPGWHIPTIEELQTLADAVDNNSNALKEIGQGTGDGAGTNTSGFSALLAGFYDDDYDEFIGLSEIVVFWSSIAFDINDAYFWAIDGSSNYMDFIIDSKNYGFSVRCIKD